MHLHSICMSILLILLIIAAIAVFWLLTTYNKFVALKTQIEASIQEIGNQLKRQTDLIPNLVESVKGYMQHETQIFDKLTEARKMVMEVVSKKGDNAQALVDASTQLQQAMAPIRAVLESNPQIQAAGPTQNLMGELRDTADKVMYARRTLIDLTADYNMMVVQMPSNLVATLFNFTKQPGLKLADMDEATSVSTEETKSPKVSLN